MKRWHRSMKRKPKVGEDILIIWNGGDIEIGTILLDEFGEGYFYTYDCSYDWEGISDLIRQWAYVDKYFAKELNK